MSDKKKDLPVTQIVVGILLIVFALFYTIGVQNALIFALPPLAFLLIGIKMFLPK